MNRERIREVARYIEKSPKNYDQSDWGPVQALVDLVNEDMK